MTNLKEGVIFMKIAIVGAGLSGSTLLKTIINHPNFNDTFSIDIYESRDRLGVGLAYDHDDGVVMLNVDPEGLSLDENNPLDFVEWLERNYDEPKNFEGLVSRPRFGEYIENSFKPYFEHPQVTPIFEEVSDLHIIGDKYNLSTLSGAQYLNYDAVFLALGHPDYADYYNLKGFPNYIHNPYPMDKQLSAISNDSKVGIIGSGATGMDLVRFFTLTHTLKTPPTFFVRNDAFYFAQIPYSGDEITFSFSKQWIKSNRIENLIPFSIILNTIKDDLKTDGINLTKVYETYDSNHIETVKKAINANDQDLAHVQAYISKLIQFMPDLYNCLSHNDKTYYHANYYKKMLLFKSLIPNKSYQRLLELVDNEQIKIVNNLKTITPTSDEKFKVETDREHTVDVLINATGFNTSLSYLAETSTLVKNLYNKNILLSPESGKSTLVSWPYAQVLNQLTPKTNNLFLFGNLINGTQHENNDAKLIMKQSIKSANWWMDQKQ